MPKEVIAKLEALTLKEAYPARYDMQNYDDAFPTDVISVAHPIAEAFEIAKIHWGDQGGSFTPLSSGAHKVVYPVVKKHII